MPAPGNKCFHKYGKLNPHIYGKNTLKLAYVVFITSALTWHHFYALTLVRPVADFCDFCIGLLELVVKNKTRENDVAGMNVCMLSSVCRAR